jgi:hypothetical protein
MQLGSWLAVTAVVNVSFFLASSVIREVGGVKQVFIVFHMGII